MKNEKTKEPISILFYCLGNICRSPLAEALFRYKVHQRGLDHYFHIDSAGTSNYHEGEPPHPGSQRVALERLGLDISNQKSQALTKKHLKSFDYLIAMDHANLRDGMSLGNGNFRLLREFEPNRSESVFDVPDPWGCGAERFEYVYKLIDQCCENLLDYLIETHSIPVHKEK